MEYITITSGKMQKGDQARILYTYKENNNFEDIKDHAFGLDINPFLDRYEFRRPVESEPSDWY